MIKRTDSSEGINVFPSTKKLSVQVSLNGLSFSVLNMEANRLDSAGSYEFPRELNEESVEREIALIMDQFGLASESFDQIQLICQTGHFALVPEPLFDEASVPHYLKLNARLDNEAWPRFDRVAGAGLVNVYQGYPKLERWIEERFDGVGYRHSGSVLIETFLKQPHWDNRPHCFVRVGSRNMEIVLIKNQALLAYNQFSFSNSEDFLYYLLMFMEQSDVEPEEADVILFGKVSEDHPLFRTVYRYVRNLHLLDPEYDFDIAEEVSRPELDYTVISVF